MLQNLTTVFFDLDGTLINPRRGITQTLAYLLDAYGKPAQTPSQLERFIGPPIREIARELLGLNDPKDLDRAADVYRAKYAEGALFDNDIYPGIPELLSGLADRGVELFVVTAKTAIFARRIVEQLQFDRWFTNVYGPELDGRWDKKSELLGHVVETHGIDPRRSAMVGDRANDINAAKANHVCAVGVSWGYGTVEELTHAGADFIQHAPSGLQELLFCERPFTE